MASSFEVIEWESSLPSKFNQGKTMNQQNEYYFDTCDNIQNDGACTLFDLTSLSIPFPTVYRLQHMGIGGNTVAYAMSNNSLYYFDWKSSSYKPTETDINKIPGSLYKFTDLFCDPVLGCHVLVSANTSSSLVNNTNGIIGNANILGIANNHVNHELLYLNTSTGAGKLKTINKLRNYEVTAIGWNRIWISSQSTSFMLVGTSKGLIFEMEIETNGVDIYCRTLYDIGKSSNAGEAAIKALEFHQFKNTPECYFVLVMTSTRLHQFVGKTTGNDEKLFLSQVFNNYLNAPAEFIPVPSTDSVFSVLRLHYVMENSEDIKISKPSAFACHLNGQGILYGKLNTEWNEGKVTVCFPTSNIYYENSLTTPISFALTEFHLLLLFTNKIVAISVLNEQIVFVHKNNDSSGRYIDIYTDHIGNIWVLSEKNIFKGKFVSEYDLAWKMYLDMNQFDLAKKYCSNNWINLRTIKLKEAEYCFENGEPEKSAILYSEIIDIPFEEIAIKFLQASEINALKKFLFNILDRLKPSESAHITIITLWLLETYEKEFMELKNGVKINRKAECNSDQYEKFERDFEKFLSSTFVYDCISTNKETVYKILQSYGDFNNFIKIASCNEEYENLMKYYLDEGRADLALGLFSNESILIIQKILIRNYIGELIQIAPKETVDLLTRMGRNLDPLSLIPSIIVVSNSSKQALEIIRYLEYCVHSLHLRDEIIHNYLITLYVEYKPHELMQYLATQGSDLLMVNYDARYALKICQEHNLQEACVQLCALLGLWETSVDLALSVNLDLAKQMAVQPSHQNPELCKKLWLKIAQHVVHECNDIEKAMCFLQQCDLIKIEDVLPFFSNFTTIDLFKDAICSSLKICNERIELLKEEVEDAVKSADLIRSDIESFKQKYNIIHSSDICCSCNIQLVLRPFHVFPCSHYFHTDCLIAEVKPYLDEYNILRLENLMLQLSDLTSLGSNEEIFGSTNSNVSFNREEIKMKIDSIIAQECFFCGNLTIDQIDKPFVRAEEFHKMRLDWE